MEQQINQIIEAMTEEYGVSGKEAEAILKLLKFREFPPKKEELSLWSAKEWAKILFERFEKPSFTNIKEVYINGVMDEITEQTGKGRREAWEMVNSYGLWELFDKKPREVQQVSYEKMARIILSTQ